MRGVHPSVCIRVPGYLLTKKHPLTVLLNVKNLIWATSSAHYSPIPSNRDPALSLMHDRLVI